MVGAQDVEPGLHHAELGQCIGDVRRDGTELHTDASFAAEIGPDVADHDGEPRRHTAAGGGHDQFQFLVGTLVTVVCATEAGDDGSFGTSDDAYTAPVSATVDADGVYELDVDGTACWRSVAPAPGLMVRGESSTLESPTTPQVIDLGDAGSGSVELVATVDEIGTPSGDGVVDDVVWIDLDDDRIIDTDEPRQPDVMVSLLDLAGSVVGTVVTGDDGTFHFDGLAAGDYRLVASNLPAGFLADDTFGRTPLFSVSAGTDIDLSLGLHPAGMVRLDEIVDAGEVPSQLLAPPPADTLRGRSDEEPSPIGLPIVIAVLAAMLGASVVLGSVRPQRVAGPALRLA